MSSLAPALETLQPTLAAGVVLDRSGDGWRVDTGTRAAPCRLALSCLVQPRPGDRVLLALEGSGVATVLAVLDRPEGAPGLELALEGPADLHVAGSLNLRGDGDLNFQAARTLEARAERLELSAQDGQAQVERFSFLGRFLRTQVQQWHLLAIQAEQVFQRITSTARESVRLVERHDEVQAGSRRVLVERDLTLQSERTHLLSRKKVSVTADRIHLN
jgi:hypothetical protein